MGQMVAVQGKKALGPVVSSLQEHLGKQIVNYTGDKLLETATQFLTKQCRSTGSSKPSEMRKRLDAVKKRRDANASSKSSPKKCPEAMTSETALLKKQVEQLMQKLESALSELADLKQKSEKPQNESELAGLKQKSEKPQNESDEMKPPCKATEEAIHETPEMAELKKSIQETQEVARLKKMLSEAKAVAKIQKDSYEWMAQYV